jgi:formiminotetrahydrofolate cyclodeaminase
MIVGEDRCAGFLRVLDPTDTSTGGGTASAIAGSMAAAIAAKVARLSLNGAGTEANAYYEPIAEEGAALAEALRAAGDEDASAFAAVMAAYRLPKVTDGEKAARTEAIRAGMAHATRVPLRNAELCSDVQDLLVRLEGRSNPRALSDLQSAVQLAQAGLRGCLANVEINLPNVRNESAAAEIGSRVEALLARQSAARGQG